MFWFWFYFGISFLIITTQTITTWYVFNSFSQIENEGIRKFQSIAFCTIISFIIIGSVFIGEKEIAVSGAILEVLINFYYYAKEFWENGYKSFRDSVNEDGSVTTVKQKKRQSILKFWRKYWLKFIFGIIIPTGIYICSEMMLKLSE